MAQEIPPTLGARLFPIFSGCLQHQSTSSHNPTKNGRWTEEKRAVRLTCPWGTITPCLNKRFQGGLAGANARRIFSRIETANRSFEYSRVTRVSRQGSGTVKKDHGLIHGRATMSIRTYNDFHIRRGKKPWVLLLVGIRDTLSTVPPEFPISFPSTAGRGEISTTEAKRKDWTESDRRTFWFAGVERAGRKRAGDIEAGRFVARFYTKDAAGAGVIRSWIPSNVIR